MAHIDKVEVRAWDVAEHLETEADMTAYLDAALAVARAPSVSAELLVLR